MSTTHFGAANAARQKFFKELSLIGTFFVLTVTISNVAYGIFGFKLLPVFKVTFDTFHAWCHFILHIFVFSWLTYFLEWLWYGLIWFCSWFLPIIPWRPRIIIPGLVTDVALVSLALTRVFQSADLIVPRPIRAEGREQDDLRALGRDTEGRGTLLGSGAPVRGAHKRGNLELDRRYSSLSDLSHSWLCEVQHSRKACAHIAGGKCSTVGFHSPDGLHDQCVGGTTFVLPNNDRAEAIF